MMIEASELTKRYGSLTAVDNVSFSVDRGEIVGLLGPNGAGKTTIMKILTGYHFADEGSAVLNGHEVATEPLDVKRSLGYLPESAPLYGDLTVHEYLSFIADAREIDAKELSSVVERVVDTCGLDEVLHRPIDELSKGFRQRVGLAQALMHDPEILILDEPTTGLDPNQIQEIRRVIRDLGKSKTVILSTHILQEVEAVCDRVMILHEGRIVAAGTTDQIGRELKGQRVYHVELAPATPEDPAGLSDESREALSQLGEVVETESESAGDFRIAVRDDIHGSDLFDWAVAAGVKLEALALERVSLEDIFARLTSSADDETAGGQE
jgi:ABC-2 type transport system ATP-binding protein